MYLRSYLAMYIYKLNNKNKAPFGFLDIKNFSTLKLNKRNYTLAPLSKYYVMASNFIKMAHNFDCHLKCTIIEIYTV